MLGLTPSAVKQPHHRSLGLAPVVRTTFGRAVAARGVVLALLSSGCVIDAEVGTLRPPCSPGYITLDDASCIVDSFDGAVRDGGSTPDAFDGGARDGSAPDGGRPQAPDRACPLAVRDPRAPVLFFSDLQSGPNHGGERGLGVFVTLYGLRFGAQRGESVVTFGGVEVARYVAWNEPTPAGRELEAIVVQIGGNAVNGEHEFAVTVNGRTSNPLSFVQRPGDIFFVDPSQPAGGNGRVETPWNSLYDARGLGVVDAGDTVYIKAGTGRIETIDPQSIVPDADWDTVNLVFDGAFASDGAPAAPIAYVGYPGAYPSIGGNPDFVGGRSWNAISFPRDGDYVSDYVIANMTLGFTRDLALELSGPGRRIVGVRFDDIEARFEQIAGFDAQRVRLLGNYATNATGEFIWLRSANDLEFGWNHIDETSSHAFHVGGMGFDDRFSNVSIHDNLVEGVGGWAFWIGENDTLVSDVRVYNNVVRNAAMGAVHFSETMDHLHGTMSFTNNTFFQSGTIDYTMSAGEAGRWTMRNNILTVLPDTPQYYVATTDTDSVTGDHNLYFGAMTPTLVPDVTEREVADPQFMSADGSNLRLRTGSPAINTGADTMRCSDFYGVARPQGAAYDRGAIEATP